jgi:enoyl-CoA hydratase
MVNKVVPLDQLGPAAQELAQKLLTRGPLGLRIAKKQVNAASVARMADLYLFESELWERNHMSPDFAEGFTAAIEKRPPRYVPEAGFPKLDIPPLK